MRLFRQPALLLAVTALAATGCHRKPMPTYAANYHEFAYITNSGSNTVAAINLETIARDRVIGVGNNPTGIAASPTRDEVYAVNTDSGTVSVIDTAQQQVTATIGVGQKPYFIAVSPDGARGYVPNSASNNITVLDLVTHRAMGTVAAGQHPGVARVTSDNRTLVVANRGSGSVSIYAIHAQDSVHPLTLRATFAGCAGATDIALRQDQNSPKAFIACSDARQVMVVWLAVDPAVWAARQDSTLAHDQLLAMLDVGTTPTHLAMKPDESELFSTNFNADSISEMSAWTNEVAGTYTVGSKPSQALFARDDNTLWVTNFGADNVALYSADDGRVEGAIHTGSGPDALALSPRDQHLLLVADARSGDIAVIRTDVQPLPVLVTLLPSGSRPSAIAVKGFKD
jgi:YVTN family beta-propeller protein